MKDDEEYRSGDYSAGAGRSLNGVVAISDDDDLSDVNVVADADDVNAEKALRDVLEDAAATQTEESISYGDLIVEELSAEEGVRKMEKLTHLSETTVEYILSVVFLIVGVLCITITSYIHIAFRYIVGSFMALLGLWQFVGAIKTKEYVHTHSNKTATSLIMMGLSALIIVEAESADLIIAVAWGIIGLFEAAHAFNHAFSRIARSERSIYYITKGVIELSLAFILLHDPLGDHLSMHIFVLGINFIVDAITMFPPIKMYLSQK